MKNYIKFKAGPAILDMIRQEGLVRAKLKVFAGPAGGPKWFISVGFDKGLIASRFLESPGKRVVLAGSSAGAWRCIAMAAASPLDAYENLRLAYSRNVFNVSHTPDNIRDVLARNVSAFIRDEDLPIMANHPVYDLVVHTVLSRGLAASESKSIQGLGILMAALLNVVSPRAMAFAFERVIFFSGSGDHDFIRNSFSGISVRLTEENLRQAALATGCLPYIIAGVRDIPCAPAGVYRDGGILDYQLNQDYSPEDGGFTLFFHYQERIVPGWFDKSLPWRKPTESCLRSLLQVYPGQDFVDLLPDRRIPDRSDFKTFVNDPSERFRRWDRAAELSTILWDEFIEAVESGRIKSLVEPL